MNTSIQESVGVPQRETEIGREVLRLFATTERMEYLHKNLVGRLGPFLSHEMLAKEGEGIIPENSSKFAQELSGINGRLTIVASALEDLLGRLEI